MVMSMTGFGRCETEINGRQITVEIKSVNHRFFEFSCRATRGYAFIEEKAKSYVNKRVARGKVDMFVSISADNEADSQVLINHSLAAGYIKALHELSETYGIEDDTSVSVLSRYSDIFTVKKAPEDEDKIWEDVSKAVDIALDNFISMRKAEGEKLKLDVLTRANKILSIVNEIEERSPQTVLEYEQRMTERIKEFLDGANFDEQRVLTEVAIFADKVAVAEETVRLRSHFEQLNSFLNSDGAIGRKLDFILQEMNREANTIGSKVQDALLAHKVVDIKAELEKIREQIQNIE